MMEGHELNISVIREYDDHCLNIIDKSSSAHVYKFDNTKNTWTKTKIGGVFFLYARSAIPKFAFMILNRKSPNSNHLEFINKDLQLKFQSGFLLYRTAKGDIYSVWFYSSSDCERISKHVGKLVQDPLGNAEKYVVKSANKVSNTFIESKASKLNNSDTKPTEKANVTDATSKPMNQDFNQLMNIIRACGADTTKNSTSKDATKSGGKKQSTEDQKNERSIYDMLQQAAVNFNSDTIDKSTNNDSEHLQTSCNLLSTITLDSKLKKTKIQSRNGTQLKSDLSVTELEEQLLRDHNSTDEEGSSDDQEGQSAVKPLSHVGEPCFSKNDRRLLSDDPGYADDVDEDYANGKKKYNNNKCDSIKSNGSRKEKRLLSSNNEKDSSNQRCPPLLWGNDTLLTPDMLVATTNATDVTNSSHQSNVASDVGLTKEQFKETLINLLQTDDDFVHRIHDGYVAVLQQRLQKK